MKHIRRHLTVSKITLVLLLAIFLTGLISVGSLRAQLKKEEVNFEYMAAVTMKSGDVLWNLAEQYYKDPMKWKIIAEKNKIANERRISIGTVVYIPVEDAKKIAKETEKVIETKKVAVDECALKLAEMQRELDRLRKEHEDSLAKLNEALNAIKERDALIAELQDKINALNKQIEAQAELEARLEDMRIAAKSTAERKDELSGSLKEKDAAIAEKEARIADMEWKLKQSQSELSRYEEANKELRMKIEMAEKNRTSMEERRPAKAVCGDSRSKIAAMAIALVGSIIWMASDK
ncbi:MAG: LysM peptidoglycan-binding protein [Candidatus Poribacteria bacterium]|nr:LysM peptidoglycan-binding protein [Candidatus Poribacteria bacterium]